MKNGNKSNKIEFIDCWIIFWFDEEEMREINIKIIIFIWIEFKISFDFVEFMKIDENNENDKFWILFDFEFVNIEFIFEIIPNEISSS